MEFLDLSRLASEYGRHIHPCKACFSTAAALCHWPCSCYPNYSLGQTQDWMNDIYPMWVAAHGIMIVTPVNWYQVSSPLKLMMDRLVCADGGNPDPTRTHGKDASRRRRWSLPGWDYPRHLAGRLFAVVVHGDVEGAENVRRSISDWLCFMHLCPAGPKAELDRYIGYWKPYATSHEELDADHAIQEEVRNAARTLLEGVDAKRSGRMVTAGENPVRASAEVRGAPIRPRSHSEPFAAERLFLMSVRRQLVVATPQLRRNFMARKYSRSASRDVKSAMRRRKRGTLKRGKGGRGGKVKSRKQAIAIGPHRPPPAATYCWRDRWRSPACGS